MAETTQPQDPLEAIQKMWGSMGFSLPGMVAPTLDVNDLDKRIADLKAVEGWMKLNLGMIQMSIQGLEMQRTTVAAMAAFGQSAGKVGDAQSNPFGGPPDIWPWNLLNAAAGEGAKTSGAAPETEPDKKPG